MGSPEKIMSCEWMKTLCDATGASTSRCSKENAAERRETSTGCANCGLPLTEKRWNSKCLRA